MFPVLTDSSTRHMFSKHMPIWKKASARCVQPSDCNNGPGEGRDVLASARINDPLEGTSPQALCCHLEGMMIKATKLIFLT